jgi:hypothetical protein
MPEIELVTTGLRAGNNSFVILFTTVSIVTSVAVNEALLACYN